MPPLLIAAAILFWGGQTGMWWVAIPVAVITAPAPFARLRWDFTSAQLYRVADFCTVLTLGFALYLYLSYGNPRAITLLFQWLPIVLLPLTLVHAYGTAEKMDLSVLFWSLRRHRAEPARRFDPSFPSFALWLLAASAANARGEWFYAGLALLVAWPLVKLRPLSYPVSVWAAAFSFALAIGYGAQRGLHELQIWMEGAVPDWLAGSRTRTNPYRNLTRMGQIGELKRSNTIVLRIGVDGANPPRLLHRASYNRYTSSAWIAQAARFSPVAPGQPQNGWPLAAYTPPEARILVHDYSVRSDPVLSLPTGTVAVERLEARSVSRNPLGTLQIEREPGFFSYVAAFAPGAGFESAPTARDLAIPHAERAEFTRLVDELRLAGIPPSTVVEEIRAYFRGNFRYATFQTDRPEALTPIVNFMRQTRAGHCEYFATATVLLLRAAGIPARYATGFGVQEYSELEKTYVVRERHAHAWARARLDGAWIDVDTTPPDWFGIEAAAAPPWSATDLLSWLRFRAARAWAEKDEEWLALAALVIALPFFVWLAGRLYRTRRVARALAPESRDGEPHPGADSELYAIERRLRARGWARRRDETCREWAKRLDTQGESGTLAEIIELHYRYRFDPRGLTAEQRSRLKDLAIHWLEQNAARAT